MRPLFTALMGVVVLAASPADAKVDITVDKDNQTMTVVVDGVERYKWPVSSGNPTHETPSGAFRAFRLEEDHYSKEFDEAPMPHSIFFTKRGHAIHGTDSVNRLGTPVSHGCVRLSRSHATTLFSLVKADGVLNTTVTLTGSSQVALARKPKGSTRTAARTDVSPAPTEPGEVDDRSFEVMQEPTVISPQRRAARQVAPRVADDGYIYPADGSSSDQRYPAPRGYRRIYDSQGNTYYYNNDYADRRNYYGRPDYAPRPAPRQRGLFSDSD